MGGIPGKRFRNGSGGAGAEGNELGSVATECAGEAAVAGLAAGKNPGDASVQPHTPSKLSSARRGASGRFAARG